MNREEFTIIDIEQFDQIVILLQKQLRGEALTIEEEDKLESWKKSRPENLKLYHQVNDPVGMKDLLRQWHSIELTRESNQKRLIKEVSEIQNDEMPVANKVHFMRRWGWAAAVIFLLGVSVLAFFLRDNKVKDNIVQWQDIGPGSNKATLILANGSSVTLDSTGSRVIQQGNTAIQQHNGQLQYHAGKNLTDAGYNTLSTPRGAQFRVTLSDGTKVWLNSASSLKYPAAFTGKERTVELQGQGYFEVAKNADQPFKVRVNNMEVNVLGTHFDIMAYPDEKMVNTTLLEGAVQVHNGEELQLLKPGQQAILNKENQQLSVQSVAVNKVVAWKEGLFVFNNMDLPTILREISRWYDVEIVYEVVPNGKLYGGGISRHLQLSEILHFLEANGINQFKIVGRKVIVLPVQ